ncbi:hypothetical protein N7494_006518 [Penicillium frequentans]|uniref:HNH nuclease domain-containing protein n=1 Tax=Penicillium frequentans TaxID=3151616 RepID=A0AAD6GEL7_9EURO|nr:hypothetical protein N7494_006518 [Penicillium glabrum]
MSMDRSDWRNVNFYDGATGAHLGGVRQNGSITQANFFHMLTNVLLVVDAPISIRFRGTNVLMQSNTDPLAAGDYNIFCAQGTISLSDERCVRRVQSRSRSGHENAFRDSVRARDRMCVLTGVVTPGLTPSDWVGFEAAHIFPLERQQLWSDCNFNRSITRPGINPMNSVQNGILISATVHSLFDNFLVSANPDDGYKITDFSRNIWNLDGRVLDFVCRDPNNPDHIADELLRWHFRQSVLANMKGAGEPTFEADFPPGTDMMKQIMEGPIPAERLEVEFASRLKPQEDWAF